MNNKGEKINNILFTIKLKIKSISNELDDKLEQE
jgi:plasmid replication initiation protein